MIKVRFSWQQQQQQKQIAFFLGVVLVAVADSQSERPKLDWQLLRGQVPCISLQQHETGEETLAKGCDSSPACEKTVLT